MKDKKTALVTGANGHLGNNLVRELIKEGYDVIASVRNMEYKKLFNDLSCKVVYADMLNKDSLEKAFNGVDILFHVAAVFKHWSKDLEKDILQANLQGTQNVLEAASTAGIKKIIYVSSIAALDFSQPRIDEKTWGTNFPNMYFKSKNDSEKLAWQLAKKLSLNMVTVLPSGMIGPEIFGHLTPSMTMLDNIIKNRLPFDPQYDINYVHVKDVAIGMILTERNGKIGERYIIGNEYSLNSTEVINIAKEVIPSIKVPKKASKSFQMLLATLMNISSKFTKKPPLLLKGNINHYYKKKENLSIQKAQSELGFNPRNPEIAVKETFEYLIKRKQPLLHNSR